MGDLKNSFSGCLYYSANALARVMNEMAEEAFKPVGLPPSYCFLLMIANKEPGISAGDTAGVMQLKPSTITRLVDKMVDQGYLDRQYQGKQSFIYPTEKTKYINELIKSCWRNMYTMYAEKLGDSYARLITANVFELSKKLGV
ncbi:MarR family transcriptional regulator [Solitalea lacus]|uniref:MarR family transcriptional regulator n=1 Tax=Solitalea lacus TaxID=2911172 RepID=UPI001EDC716E|nr:MarR family transcriptional regulator [Solitalea lacus]UKJ06730.1 MarR family transcriptional regulator [Solitalea lacus]